MPRGKKIMIHLVLCRAHYLRSLPFLQGFFLIRS
jgi:hypothetical protein